LTPLGKKRYLDENTEGAEKGKRPMSQQMYKIKHEIAEREPGGVGDRVDRNS
jgi:hypothetical protein